MLYRVIIFFSQRLEDICGSSKPEYNFLYEIVCKEVAEGMTKKPLSCKKAILWLTRCKISIF